MKFRSDNYILIFLNFFSEADIELEEKFIEEKSMTENLENEANCLSKLSTKKKEGNTNLPVEQILSNEIPIPVGCDEKFC